MASSFGSFDLTGMIERADDDGLSLPDTNDALIRTPLAYGGESVQDSYIRLSTFAYALNFPTYALYATFRGLVNSTATLTIEGRGTKSFTLTTLNQLSNVVWYGDDRVECAARFTRKGL